MFSGCKDEEDNLKEFKVQNRDALNQNMYADETGGKSLTFVTTGAWTSTISKKSATKADETVDWININPASGAEAGEYTVTFSIATNNTGEERSVVITITCNDENLVINITQKAETKDGTKPEKSNECDILSFKVGEVEYVIDGSNIYYTYPCSGTEPGITCSDWIGMVSMPAVPTIIFSPGATINPSITIAQDFIFNSVTYVVTAEDGLTCKTYSVKADRALF